MSDKISLLEFPCDFTIKIIGSNSENFAESIKNIIYNHFANGKKIVIANKLSKNGNYLAITATVYANNKEMLDALYMELTKHPEVKMVL